MQIVKHLLSTANVAKTKPARRPSTITKDVVESIHIRMKQSPRKSVKKFSFQTDFPTY